MHLEWEELRANEDINKNIQRIPTNENLLSNIDQRFKVEFAQVMSKMKIEPDQLINEPEIPSDPQREILIEELKTFDPLLDGGEGLLDLLFFLENENWKRYWLFR